MTALSLFVSIVVAAGHPHPPTPLEEAKRAYQKLRFEDCLNGLQRWLRSPSATPDARAPAELYEGLCLYNLGRVAEAEEHLERAAQLDPSIRLPEGTSPKIEAAFRKASARAPLRAPLVEAPASPVLEPSAPVLEPSVTLNPPAPFVPASPPPPTSTRPTPSAAVRLGVPIGLGALGLATGSAFVGLGVSSQRSVALANGAAFTSDASVYAQEARREAAWANANLGVAIAATAGAIVSAILLNPPGAAPLTPSPDGPAGSVAW